MPATLLLLLFSVLCYELLRGLEVELLRDPGRVLHPAPLALWVSAHRLQ